MKILLVLLPFIGADLVVGDDGLQVHTKSGYVQGRFLTTGDGQQYRAFQGIPFAEPPVGPLRFMPPVPFKRWEGIKNATQPPSTCVQTPLGTTTVIGNEDCLYLNIFAPVKLSKGRNSRYPVIVYVHGGEFRRGSGNANVPDYFIKRNVIFVTMHYRVAAFGFLSTGDTVVPGNNGLRDQNLAMKWVKDNIHEFSGDQNAITLMGQSSGASGARLQVVAPRSKGLFHRIIAQGGNELCAMPADSLNYVTNLGKRLAERLQCSIASSQELVDCLRTKDAIEIATIENTFPEVQEHKYGFVPVIEVKHPDAFIDDYPWNYVRNGQGSKVPWLNGITLNEGTLRAATYYQNPAMLDNYNTNFEELLPNNDLFTIKQNEINAVTNEMRRFYIGNSSLQQAQKQDFIDLLSDTRVIACSRLSLHLHHVYNKQPIYNLLFTYSGYATYVDTKIPGFGFTPVEYDNELYTFPPQPFFQRFNRTQQDFDMSDIYTDFLVNFVRSGDPTPNCNPVKWNPISSLKKNEYLLVEGPYSMRMRSNMFPRRRNFWESLCSRYGCLSKFEERA